MRTFGWTDLLLILGVFVVGFIFAMVLNSYGRMKKEKIDEISRKFQGLKGEYESMQSRMHTTVKWRYRVKLIEKIYYIALLSLGFLVYKSPAILSWLLYDYPHISITFFSLSIIGFSLAGFMLDKQSRKSEVLARKLKEKLKDTKKLLISQMDPALVEAVKDIVRADMKDELQKMRDSEEGCSQKCQMTVRMHKLDVERNEVLVKELIEFHWCDQCMKGQPGAVHICQSGCGPKIFAKLLPHMKEFGRVGERILAIKADIEELSKRSIKFKDYQKAKKELDLDALKHQPHTHKLGDLNIEEFDRQREQSDKMKQDSAVGRRLSVKKDE